MSYNGWSNYETWVVKLWMDNEEPSYRYWQDVTKEMCRDLEPDTAKRNLADRLEEEHKDSLPELQGFASDLLNAAMSEVDWYEIAESMIKDWLTENPQEETEETEETN